MAKRLSITLEAEDERAVASFGKPGTPERNALVAWADERGLDVSGVSAEAALLRLLLRAGVDCLRTFALDLAYAELGATMSAADRADSRAARIRYAKRTDSTRPR